MSDNKEKLKKKDRINGDIKIQFGEKTIVCFACGQRIEEIMKVCPYCKTKLHDDPL